MRQAPLSDDRLVVVDALRGIAALAVAFHHAPRFVGGLAFLDWIQDRGYLGVGLFLVLSGFSIHFRWAASAEPGRFSHGRFWRRRVRRLYPAYLGAYALSLLIYVLYLGAPLSARSWPLVGVPPSAVAVAAAVVLPLANVVPYTYVGVAWTLGLEIQLYALYTTVAARVRRFGVVRLVVVTAIACVLFRAVVLVATPAGTIADHGVSATSAPYWASMLWTWAPARMLEWVLGLAAAEAYFGRVKLPRWTASALVAAFAVVAAMIIESSPRMVVGGISLRDLLLDPAMGIAFFLSLRALISFEPNRVFRTMLGPLATVGVFSYSLYLVHVPLERFGLLELSTHSSLGRNAELLLLMPAVVLAAYVFHLVCERPFLRGRRLEPQAQPRQRSWAGRSPDSDARAGSALGQAGVRAE